MQVVTKVRIYNTGEEIGVQGQIRGWLLEPVVEQEGAKKAVPGKQLKETSTKSRGTLTGYHGDQEEGRIRRSPDISGTQVVLLRT